MSNQATSRKSLWMALLAAVVVLTMVLCLAGCNNEQAEGETTAPTATVDGETEQLDLYWNMDRALYDGKSEAGMSSREPGEDGYFHVRFFKDGEIVELRVADRKTVNAMEVQDLMGLEFDEDGVVIGIIPVDDLPIEKLAWQFYVQSAGGKLIKANSSASLNGMEVLLETNENTGVWDMTGMSGDVGCEADPMQLDRILALGDADGNVLHVFIYERPNYMKTHEGECEHCQKTVTWYEWTKESALPLTTGHYQLMVDVSGVGQHSMPEDCKLCVDLNGHRVDGKSGARIYSLHNAGTELAIMDTSEAKTGRIAAHGQGDQGMCVWLRYGVFYLYDGILDGSDAKTYLNGPTVNMGSNTYFYMYGGELIGGTAAVKSNGKGGWSGGYGGTLFIGSNSKFVMNDGIIRGGRAKAAITKKDASGKPSAYSNGVGGNIYASTGAVIELNGGEIRGGIAENHSGNIYLGGKAELTINATLINGGKALSRTNNGGNLFVSSTAKVVMNGGTIRNGQVYNCGGNVYCNGRFQMNDGIITDGKCINWTTKKANPASSNRNVFSVNGDFYMYGGRIAGGFQAISSTDATKNPTIVLVSARSVIFDEDGTGPHLTLSNTSGGGLCTMYVGQMHDEGKVGISGVQQAVFTKPTNVNNTDNFISDIPDAEIGWCEDGLIIGKVHCLCSQDPEIGDDEHKLGCDKVQYAWTPWTSTSSLPTSEGNWYLINNVSSSENAVRTYGDDVLNLRLDLNGKTVTQKNARFYSLFENTSTYLEDGKTIAPNIEGEAIHLTLTDTLGGGTVNFSDRTDADQGQLIWGRYNDSKINILGGTYNGQNVTSKRHNGVMISASGELNIYGGTFNGGNSVAGGIISGTNINIYGGTIQNGTASTYGGNIYAKGTNAKINIYGGTVTGGTANANGSYAQGGNIWISGNGATLTVSGENAVVSDGTAITKKGTETWAPGGNIYANGKAQIIVENGATIEGGDGTDGNNIYVTTDGSKLFLYDCTIRNTATGSHNIMIERGDVLIDGATIINEAANAGNLAANGTGKVANYVIKSGTISGGTNKNIYLGGDDTLIIDGGLITDGSTVSGTAGNLFAGTNSKITMNGGTITRGTGKNGGNIVLDGTASMTINGGEVSYGCGTGDNGGNVLLWGTSTLVLNDGVIKNGESQKNNGGNIAVSRKSVFTMNGGSVIDGVSGDSGGNIVNYGRMIMTGGVVKNGKCKNVGNGMNISIVNTNADSTAQFHELQISGGTIAGGVHFNNSEGHVIVKISGNPVIDKAMSTANTPTYSVALAANDLQVGTMTSGARIMVCGTEGVFTNAVAENYTDYFKSETSGYAVGHTANGLIFGKAMCACGGKAVGVGDHICEAVIWQPWNGTSAQLSTLPTINNQINVYMTGNATLGSQIATGNKTINIDLKGYTLTNTWRLALVQDGGTLGVTDTVGTGKVLFKGPNNDHSGTLMQPGSAMNLYAGTLTMDPTSTNTVSSGGIIGMGGTFNMYGGTISAGRVTGNGGNINIFAGCVMNMYAGTVTGGKAAGNGGNIYTNGTLNIFGGTISDGVAGNGGNICKNGAGKVIMHNGTISNGTATGSSGGGNIAIWGSEYVEIKGGNISGGTGKNGGSILGDGANKIIVSGGTITGGESTVGGGGNILLWGDTDLEMTAGTVTKGIAATTGGNIYGSGTKNIITISGGTISSGRSQTGGGNICVKGTMYLSGDTVIEFGGALKNGGNLYATSGSTVNMTGGTIKNGGLTTLTDGVWGTDSSMNKGWTQGNVANDGTFTMSGGSVSGTFSCWSNSKLTLSGDASIYVKGNGLGIGGTVTIGKLNIGDTPKFTIFTNKDAAPNPKKIGNLATDVTYTEEELNKLFLGWAYNDTSIKFTFYVQDNEVWMKMAE